MAASATWRGGVNISVNAVPITLNVALYPKVKSSRGESFKTLAPNGEPIKSVYMDSDGKVVERADCSKGVEVAKDTFMALTTEQVEAVTEGTKDEVLNASYYCTLASVPLDLADQTYFVVPDAKVPGSEGNVNVLWNGLRDNSLAYVAQATLKAGSPDRVVVIYATDEGLNAASIPFEPQCYEAPSSNFEHIEGAGELFAGSIETVHQFVQGDFFSTYTTRRNEVIEAVTKGKAVKPKAEAPSEPTGQSLMDALKATKPKAKASKKKVAA